MTTLYAACSIQRRQLVTSTVPTISFRSHSPIVWDDYRVLPLSPSGHVVDCPFHWLYMKHSESVTSSSLHSRGLVGRGTSKQATPHLPRCQAGSLGTVQGSTWHGRILIILPSPALRSPFLCSSTSAPYPTPRPTSCGCSENTRAKNHCSPGLHTCVPGCHG